jgi:hypothetical protein
VSRQALTPTNVPASATAISTPTLRAGDLYYNTSTGLMVYNGTAWAAVGASTMIANLDGGAFDSIAPYNGGTPSSTVFDNTINGGTP